MNDRDDVEPIRQALQQGRLAVGNETGYQRGIHADCPKDGSRASVYMTERRREAITGVTFRCPACGEHFRAEPEDMYLA